MKTMSPMFDIQLKNVYAGRLGCRFYGFSQSDPAYLPRIPLSMMLLPGARRREAPSLKACMPKK